MSATVIHPKTGGAALGGVTGLLVTAILNQIGVHVSPDLSAAISAFLSGLGAYLAPAAPLPPPTPVESLSASQGALEHH